MSSRAFFVLFAARGLHNMQILFIWNRDAIERQLSHVEGSVRAVYNKADTEPIFIKQLEKEAVSRYCA